MHAGSCCGLKAAYCGLKAAYSSCGSLTYSSPVALSGKPRLLHKQKAWQVITSRLQLYLLEVIGDRASRS